MYDMQMNFILRGGWGSTPGTASAVSLVHGVHARNLPIGELGKALVHAVVLQDR